MLPSKPKFFLLFARYIPAWMLLFAFTELATADQVDVWFGTSTSKNGPSKGIYHASFDSDKGKLSQATLAAEVKGQVFWRCILTEKYFTQPLKNQAGLS